jgi:hypothetical protein
MSVVLGQDRSAVLLCKEIDECVWNERKCEIGLAPISLDRHAKSRLGCWIGKSFDTSFPLRWNRKSGFLVLVVFLRLRRERVEVSLYFV